MTAPAVPPPDDAVEEIVTTVTALILAGAVLSEIKDALLDLPGMTASTLAQIFTRRKYATFVSAAVSTAVAALPPIVATSTVDIDESKPAPSAEPSSNPVTEPTATPTTGGASSTPQKTKAVSPLDRPYIPTSVLDQVNKALAKKGKARPRPKKTPAASTFVKLKAAVAEAAARAGYLTAAARRLQAAYDTGDDAVIEAAETAEDRYEKLHEQAVKERARAVRAIAKQVVGKKPDSRGEILLGWYAHITPATCARCLAADGKNFDALEPPLIGFPGAVHVHDHCLPGPPHDTDARVENVDADERMSLGVAIRAVVDIRLRSTKGLAMTKTETRTAAVVEMRGPGTDKPDEKPGFTARAVQYGVADTYNTSWQRGVFAESLEQRMPSVVWGHDWNDPIGRVVAYRDSDGGLDIDVELDDFDAVPRARQAHAQLKSGSMSQFSFAFKRAVEEPDPAIRGCTRIVKADVDEFSIVLNGSVPGTHVKSVRTADGTVDAKTAADIVTRFAAGGLDLVDALTELRSGAGRSNETRVPPAARFEFRALDDSYVEGSTLKPLDVLAEVDTAMTQVAEQLNMSDVETARKYFSQAASRLSELQYLLGMVPGVTPNYVWRDAKPDGVRTVQVVQPVSAEKAEDDVALLRALDRIDGRSWMTGRGGRR
jgi:HK97 family phage prohead protease